MEKDMTKANPLVRVEFVCLECGHVKSLFRQYPTKKALEEMKDFKQWCPGCKTIVPHRFIPFPSASTH